MARTLSALIALAVVLCCCLNDTINEAYTHGLTSLLLFGSIWAQSFDFPQRRHLLTAGLASLLGGALLLTGSNLRTPLCLLPAALCASILVAQHLKANAHRPRNLLLISVLLACIIGSRSFWIHQIPHTLREEPRRAVLEHGQWGNALPHDRSLTITSQYSYDLLHRLIGAHKLHTLDQLNHYHELWMVTPTQPFTPEEQQTIRQWIKRGGRLILISDHTVLFGHATVSNALLRPYHLHLRRNIILHPSEQGGRYHQPLTATTYIGLSANSITGPGESWLIQPGYSERTDYSRPSFFSDNQISDEDHAGLHTIGLRQRHGLGGIILMGDSTLLANFALTRPSAQHLLRTLLNGGGPISCHGLALFATLAWLLSRIMTRPALRLSATILTYSSAGLCLHLAHTDYPLHLNTLPHLPVSGDSTLVEGQNAPLCTLFAAAYTLSERFPIWEHTTPGSGTIHINTTTLTRQRTPAPGSTPDHWELLTRSASPDTAALLRQSIQQSGYSTFWFDSGIGILNETAYRDFWHRINHPGSTPASLPTGPTRTVRATVTIRGHGQRRLTLHLTPLPTAPDWVIIGDGLIGKWTDSHTILLRTLWQLPDRALHDSRCQVE